MLFHMKSRIDLKYFVGLKILLNKIPLLAGIVNKFLLTGD